MKENLLIFDFDGTLYDPFQAIESSLNYVCDYFKLSPLTAEKIATLIGPPLSQSLKTEFNLSDEKIDEIVKLFRAHHIKFAIPLYKPYPEVIKTLQYLKKTSILCIGTSKPQPLIEEIIKRHNIDYIFDFVSGSLPNEGGDKTRIIQRCTSAFPEIKNKFMVGDRSFDIEAGKKLNLNTIAVTWGYGKYDELSATHPSRIITHFNELPRITFNAN